MLTMTGTRPIFFGAGKIPISTQNLLGLFVIHMCVRRSSTEALLPDQPGKAVANLPLERKKKKEKKEDGSGA